MKSQTEVLEEMSYEAGYPDWAALRNEIAGDQQLVEFYIRAFAGVYAEMAVDDCINDIDAIDSFNPITDSIKACVMVKNNLK